MTKKKRHPIDGNFNAVNLQTSIAKNSHKTCEGLTQVIEGFKKDRTFPDPHIKLQHLKIIFAQYKNKLKPF